MGHILRNRLRKGSGKLFERLARQHMEMPRLKVRTARGKPRRAKHAFEIGSRHRRFGKGPNRVPLLEQFFERRQAHARESTLAGRAL